MSTTNHTTAATGAVVASVASAESREELLDDAVAVLESLYSVVLCAEHDLHVLRATLLDDGHFNAAHEAECLKYSLASEREVASRVLVPIWREKLARYEAEAYQCKLPTERERFDRLVKLAVDLKIAIGKAVPNERRAD